MVIDTSAVLAWLKQEPERERIVAALEAHQGVPHIGGESVGGPHRGARASITPCRASCNDSLKKSAQS